MFIWHIDVFPFALSKVCDGDMVEPFLYVVRWRLTDTGVVDKLSNQRSLGVLRLRCPRSDRNQEADESPEEIAALEAYAFSLLDGAVADYGGDHIDIDGPHKDLVSQAD